MKINFTQIVKGRHEKEVLHAGIPLTLIEAVICSLNFIPNDCSLSSDQKMIRGRLIKRLDRGESDFKIEEINEMKSAIKNYPWYPNILVTLEEMMEGETELKIVSG